MMLSRDQLERALANLPGERITPDYMNSRIESSKFMVVNTTTVCFITLDNGYKVLGQSACVDPANYRQDIGEKIAYEDAFRKLWPLFGFLLAEKRFHAKEETNTGDDYLPQVKD